MNQIYQYLVMSQVDFLENQVIEEILREKATFYAIQNKKKDFWLVMQPSFIKELKLQEKIESTNFYKQQKANTENKNLKEFYYASIVSLDKDFIKWIELRTGYFENVFNPNADAEETLLKGLRPDFKSNGVKGEFIATENFSPLSYEKKKIHPTILLGRYQNAIRLFSEMEAGKN